MTSSCPRAVQEQRRNGRTGRHEDLVSRRRQAGDAMREPRGVHMIGVQIHSEDNCEIPAQLQDHRVINLGSPWHREFHR